MLYNISNVLYHGLTLFTWIENPFLISRQNPSLSLKKKLRMMKKRKDRVMKRKKRLK